jgi:flagella basal body P-ring formation protein FlgA
LVKRGEPVSLTIRSGTLLIRAQGRALSDGRRGDLVRVVALPTSRTLDGVVEANGAVRLGGE